tara:strand:+ start:740 stop:2278 length:1539 start_codon:yes stop_codon:yes gene_type:complete
LLFEEKKQQMKTTLIYVLISLCCLTSFCQNYVKIKYDENIDLSEKTSIIIGFEYDTKKEKIKQKGKYFNKSGILGRIHLAVIGGKYYEGTGEVEIHPTTAKNNNNSIVFIYNHPLNQKIEIKDTLKLPNLIGLKMANATLKHLYPNLKYKMNLEASFSNGKTQFIPNNKIYTFLLANKINMEINGAERVPEGSITVDNILDDSLKNFVSFRYTSIEPNFKASVDSFVIPGLLNINISPKKFSYGAINKLVATASFSNGKQKKFSGKKLQNLLVGYGINASTKNGEIINGAFTTFKFSETKSDSAYLNLKSNRMNENYTFPIVLDKSYSYKANKTKSSPSFNGNHGEHLTIIISEIPYRKDIFKINISNNTKTDTFYLNPNLGNLTIESLGSNGSIGKKGINGKDEFENSKATRGENGGNGGDGGDGGNINIHLPKSFSKFIQTIKLKNDGGKGGQGGSGGSGGIFLDNSEPKGSFWLSMLGSIVVGTPGMNDGSSGESGRNGRNGEINFIYY